MSWHTGTATDYKDLFNKVVQIVTSNSVATAVVSAGGTGYVVGDVLTASGGTFLNAAKFRVTTESGGVVTGLVIQEGGSYSSNPSSPVSTTGGTGTGCTVTVTFSGNGWTAVRQTSQASTATVAAGGTGYTVGDDITVVGGNFATAAVFNVDSVSSGAITAVSLVTAGEYRDKPTNPVSVTGGTGTGGTLNVTFIPYTGANEREAILQGIGSGSDTIYVGMKSYNVLSQNSIDTTYNWNLIGMTGFNSSLNFESQAGVSPGGIPVSTGGAYVPLHNNGSFPITYWVSVTGRRIIGIFKVENSTITHYTSMYLGWLNPFGTSTEFPYPIYVSGSSARHDVLFSVTSPSMTGLTEMIGLNARTGPGYVRFSDGTWKTVRNSVAVDTGSPTRAVERAVVVYPCGQTALTFVATDDLVVNDSLFDFDDMIPPGGVPGTATKRLQKTPNTGGDLALLVPATVCLTESAIVVDVWGELDDVFWVSGIGMSSGDTVTIGTQRYRVFQNGNRTTDFSFMAIKEN